MYTYLCHWDFILHQIHMYVYINIRYAYKLMLPRSELYGSCMYRAQSCRALKMLDLLKFFANVSKTLFCQTFTAKVFY